MGKSIMRITITTLLLVVMLTLPIAQAFAVIAESANSTVKYDNKTANEMIAQATKWLEKNYGEFNVLRNVDADIVRVFENNSETRYTVAMTGETLLKYDSTADLPFVKIIALTSITQ